MQSKHISYAFFVFTVLCIIGVLYIFQGQYIVNGNISWLLIAAQRLLDGQTLSQHIFETNPPLSILVYVPHVLFSQFLKIPLPVGAFYFTTLLVCFSTASVAFILKSFDFLKSTEKRAFILGYLVSATLITTLFYGEREHFIFLGLMPFILGQYALTHHINISRTLLTPALFIGALCILIKPHYGLLPVVFLIKRAIYQKRLNIFLDADFLALSMATLLYLFSVFVFFSDYLTVILPDVLALYTDKTNPLESFKSVYLYLILTLSVFFLELFQEDLSRERKEFILTLLSCSLLCLLPYFVQMKGFDNHIYPIYAFFICTLSVSIAFRTSRFFKHEILHILIPLICILFITSIISPLSTKYPRKTDIPTLPIGAFLEQECPAPCTFFAFHGDIEIINPTAAHMGYTHGSRFPSFWFLPSILQGLYSETPENREKFEHLKDKYTQMIVEDLEHYKPSILLIAENISVVHTHSFRFLDFFGTDESLKHIFDTYYEEDQILAFDQAAYFKGSTFDQQKILTYIVYKRKDQAL